MSNDSNLFTIWGFWTRTLGSDSCTEIALSFFYTAKRLYRKFETNIPINETAQTRSQFLNSCFGERFIYIPTIGPPILLQENRWTDRGNIYTKSFTDTWMWILGCAVSFWGIHKSDFFAVLFLIHHCTVVCSRRLEPPESGCLLCSKNAQFTHRASRMEV